MFATGLRLVLIYFALAAPLAAQEPAPAAPPTADLTRYPDSERGLRELIGDMLDAAERGDAQQLARMAESLVAADPRPWLEATFGAEDGSDLARQLGDRRGELSNGLQKMFRAMVAEKLSRVEVVRFSKGCSLANEPQFHVLMARIEPRPLYEVRVSKADGSGTRNLWFFAYTDGGFRFLGRIRFLGAAEDPTAPQAGAAQIQVPADRLQRRGDRIVGPVYPPKAKKEHIEGTVRLSAVIGTDGIPRELRLMDGNCILAEAAFKAAGQWRYEPMVIAGRPVEVHTTIEIRFTLTK